MDMKDIRAMRAKNPIDFKLAAVPGETRTAVYLYGDIVDETPVNWWTGQPEEGDFITPKGVRDLVDGITGGIDLHINSYGGSVWASTAIANYLVTSGKNIDVYVDGIAASGASIIAMAGDRIKIFSNAALLIHRASGYVYGNTDDALKLAERLEKADILVKENYMARFSGTSEELDEILKKDQLITAREALEYGLVDEIIVKEKEEEPEEEPEEVIVASEDGANFYANFRRN